MNQKNCKNQFDGLSSLYKPICGTALLCSFLFASPMQTFASDVDAVAITNAQITVKGKVVDASGEPIIGANIKQVGTTTGSISDFDGNFTLNVEEGSTIEVSYIGYKTQTLKATRNMKIVLKEDTELMDEVVVIGYCTVKKRDLTGAVVSVKSEEITVVPTGNVMEALQGRVTGLDITKTSGQAGAGVNILLRGNRSIYGSNSPLFIVDGLPGSYGDLNPNDVESIEVLKDASSTAIYGSAGANGVIIITTKRGSAGKVNVNFDAYYGWSGTPEYKNGMTGDEWYKYQAEAYKYKNGSEPSNISALMGGNQAYIDAYNNGEWIDFVDLASGNKATTQKYALSVTGGTEKTKIYSSIVYSQDKGLLEGEQLDKYAARLAVDQQIFDWAKVGITTNIIYSRQNSMNGNVFKNSITAMPLGQPFTGSGEINHEYIENKYNPMSDQIENQFANERKSTNVNAIGYLELTPIKGLKFRTQLNASLSHSRLGQYWGANCNANRPSYAGTPHASLQSSDGYGYNWENILSYNITVAEDHDFGLTGITSWNHDTSEWFASEGSNQDLDVWQYWRLIAATSSRVESNFTQSQKMSYAVRFSYSYKGKYLFTFSTRWDGVSFFSDGKKWDSFPAGAVAWRISDEGFMEDTKDWLSNLKLRVGAGITGNSGGVGAYSTQTNAYKYPAWGISIGGTYVPFTQYSGTYGSPSLGWEKSYNWNFGIDFGLFNNRFDGSIDYYTTRTKGLLYKRTMPITSGITGWGSPLSSWENIASTMNEGVEVTLNSRNITTKDFTWNTTLTTTWSREKITSLPSGDLISENLFVGRPIKSIYDYKYAGIWGTDASQETLDAYGVKPGWVKIETIEKDGDGGVHKYSEDDRQILGHETPNWIIGLNNTFTYKNFDLTVYAMGRFGQTIYSDLLGMYTAKSGVGTNTFSGADYWTEDNQGAYYPRPGSGDEQTVGISSLRVFDGSFIKIKNITLGYTLPKSISKHALMEKCRFYFTAYNPWIFAFEKQLDGTDPESGGSDSFPTYKQFVFGVNVTF